MKRFPFAGVAVAAVFLVTALLRADPRYDQSSVPLEVDAPRPGLTKVLVLAGKPSSKAMAHEYFAGCALIAEWLRAQPGVWPVMARGWPENPAVLEGVRCVVYYGDGGGKQPFLAPERWAALRRLHAQGAGFVLLHQAMDFPAGEQADEMRGWLGAVFSGERGCRGHWDMEFTQIPTHAVTRGVTPFAAPADGWLYNLDFEPRGVTPLLLGSVPESSRTSADAKRFPGRAEVIAWAYEAPSGGRGFGFTGADLHASWSYPSQRALVLNGIVWAAGLPVPEAGASSAFAAAMLERNLDDKRTPRAR